jgi:hypothetical protein
LLNGTDKTLTFVVPKDVTIHRTPILKADDVFLRHAGRLLKPSYFVRQSDREVSAKESGSVRENPSDEHDGSPSEEESPAQ